MEWFYVGSERQTQGPHTLERLVELFRDGAINGETLIWTKAMPDWAPARTCQEFFAALRAMSRPADARPPPLPPVPSVAPAPIAPEPIAPEPDTSMEAAALATLAAPAALAAPIKLEADPQNRIYAPEPVALEANPLHPWRRFFARQMDIGLVAFTIGIGVGIFFSQNAVVDKVLGNNIVIAMLTTLVLVPLEAIQLAVFGTTFGKALYSIEVKSKNPAPIGFATAFARAFSVYVRGLALGFPLISLFTVYFGYKTLKEKGEASWDAENELVVSHRPLGYVRIAVIAFVWLFYLTLMGYGVYTEVEKRTGGLAGGTPRTGAKTLEQTFVEVESRLRPTLPSKIDEITTLVRIWHAGNTLLYTYEIELDRAKTDPKQFQAGLDKTVKQRICANASLRDPLIAGGNYTFIYNDKQSQPVARAGEDHRRRLQITP